MKTDLAPRIGRAAGTSGMELSWYVAYRVPMAKPLPVEAMRRAVRQKLALSLFEERRKRDA